MLIRIIVAAIFAAMASLGLWASLKNLLLGRPRISLVFCAFASLMGLLTVLAFILPA